MSSDLRQEKDSQGRSFERDLVRRQNQGPLQDCARGDQSLGETKAFAQVEALSISPVVLSLCSLCKGPLVGVEK